MEDDGLAEVNSPSQMLLDTHEGAAGSAVVATLEGSRIFLHEIQALVGSTNYANPRRVAVGLEYNRLLLYILCLFLHYVLFHESSLLKKLLKHL